MLERRILRPEANALFDILCSAPELIPFTLVGGTALALQIGHRTSLDFDFALFEGTLPGFFIDQMMARLKQEGHKTQMITSPAAISQFKINTGLNLLDQVRDYAINGVKVTFFIHGKNELQKSYYQSAKKIHKPGMSFNLLGIEGMKRAKTLVLADRVRSRDLYDLYRLCLDHNYTMEELFSVVTDLGTVDDPEYYKAVMRGETPLDADDEGLERVGLEHAEEDIYAYFTQEIEQYEIRLAREYFMNLQGKH